MDQRVAWITDFERCRSVAETCHRHGISRATLRKWWRRYEADGLAGLAERSRAPVRSPSRKVTARHREAVLALRAEGLGFGRIRNRLALDGAGDLSVATIRRIVARADPAWRPVAVAQATTSPPRSLVATAAPEGVAAQLAEAIHAGHFRPGEKLTEEALGASLRCRPHAGPRSAAKPGLPRHRAHRAQSRCLRRPSLR